jgi:7-cyano-7-deazaguanine synthase
MEAVVLLSGGMDSTTALAQAIADGAKRIVAISVTYGSVHGPAEMAAAAKVANYYRVAARRIIQLGPIFNGSSSALMGGSEIPSEEYHNPEKETPSVTVVPFRNANLISVAATIAEIEEADLVYFGVHATDARGFAYPDCTPEFMGAMEAAVYIGTHRKVRLVAPFQWMAKSDIVVRAAELGAPLHLTWSCYRGGAKQCGKCPTCRERAKAFDEAGFLDPVGYEIAMQYRLGCKPWPYSKE